MRPASIPAAAASLLVATTTVLYLALIDSQGSGDQRRVAVWVIALATCAVVGAVAAWCREPKVRAILLAVTGGALLGLGVLGVFSIGLLLLLAGVLFIAGAPSEPAAAAYASGAVAFVAAPILVLWAA